MAEFKRKALINWDYIKNEIKVVSLDTATAGDLNSYEFIISLVNAEEIDLTGYKLTTLYSSQSTVNSGIIAPVKGEDNVYTVQLPSEMFVAGIYDICLSLSNDKKILCSVLFGFQIFKNLMTSVSEAVNNNLSDFQKMFLASLPDDESERLEEFGALIDAKADKTALATTNAEVAKKATITSVNQKLPIVSSDSSSTGLAYTITSANIPALAKGYSFKFIPTITTTVQTATLAINGGMAYPFAKANSYTGDKVALSSSNAPVNFLKANVVYTLIFTGSQFAISEESLTDVQGLSGAVPIANGGTGNIYGTASSTSITTGIASLLTFKLSAVGNTSRMNLRTANSAEGGPTTNTFDGMFACFPATTVQDGKFFMVDRTTGIWYAGTGQYTYLDGTWTNTTGSIYWTQIFDSGTTIPIKNGGTGNTTGGSQNIVNQILKTATDLNTLVLSGATTVYYFNNQTLTNAPTGVNPYSTLLSVNGQQLIIDIAKSKLYLRTFNNSIWSTWKVLLNEDSFPIGSVQQTTINTAPSFYGTWISVGNQTIGSKTVYYWERTA